MKLHHLSLCFLLAAAAPVHAQQAFGTDVFASDDADGSSVLKTGLYFDPQHADIEHYQGIELERARFRTFDGEVRNDTRAYYRFADTGERWKWNGRIGGDGDTWLGSFSVHTDEARRQEYFLERDVVETPLGLERGIRSTFAGAAYDLPLDERNVFTALAGVQDFTGDNRRLHLRARYIRVLDDDWGLSAQLRARYFRSSDPHEFDYYSPRWYAEAIPVLQLRRFHKHWMFQAAAGVGWRRDSDSDDWRSARLFEASVTSPKSGRDWFFKASALYSNTPVTTSDTYHYTQVMVEAYKTF